MSATIKKIEYKAEYINQKEKDDVEWAQEEIKNIDHVKMAGALERYKIRMYTGRPATDRPDEEMLAKQDEKMVKLSEQIQEIMAGYRANHPEKEYTTPAKIYIL